MKNPELEAVLNDIEKLELAAFASNVTMMNAVKKVLLFDTYFNGVLKAGEIPNAGRNYLLSIVSDVTRDANGNMIQRPTRSDAEIGAEMRASWQAINIVEGAFSDLLSFKPVETVEAEIVENPAR